MNRRCFLAAISAGTMGRAGGSPSLSGLSTAQLTASTACLAGRSFPEAVQTLHDLKFDGIEIIAFVGATHSVGSIPGAVVAQLGNPEKSRLRRSVGRFRFVTTHLPFHGLHPAARDANVRESVRRRIFEAVDDSGFWRASVATAHASAEPGQSLAEARYDLIDFFRRLGDHAARRRVRIGIETGWPNTVEAYLGLIRDIDHPNVGATVDTGHIRSYRADIGVSDGDRASEEGARRYNDVLLRIVDGLRDKLFHFHVDDVRPSDWRDHCTLGTGIIDWPRLLRRLTVLRYSGALALELEEQNTIGSVEDSRKYFQDALRRAAGFAGTRASFTSLVAVRPRTALPGNPL